MCCVCKGTKHEPAPAKPKKPSSRAKEDPALARAKVLVQRKVGVQIDNYFYHMNKTYQATGAMFLLSSRLLAPVQNADGTYTVTCHAKARTGIDEKHLISSDFPCGRWLADLATQLVLPNEAKARQIAQ